VSSLGIKRGLLFEDGKPQLFSMLKVLQDAAQIFHRIATRGSEEFTTFVTSHYVAVIPVDQSHGSSICIDASDTKGVYGSEDQIAAAARPPNLKH
jgi:hypothetical protein